MFLNKNLPIKKITILTFLVMYSLFFVMTTINLYTHSQYEFSKNDKVIKNFNITLSQQIYEKFNNRKEAVGFKTSDKKEKAEPTIEDFYDVGMPKEFMGRFPTIIHLNDLSKENLKDVFTKSDESPLLREKEHFKKVGVELTATDDYIDAIANKAYQLKYGARGLAGLTLESTWMAYD